MSSRDSVQFTRRVDSAAFKNNTHRSPLDLGAYVRIHFIRNTFLFQSVRRILCKVKYLFYFWRVHYSTAKLRRALISLFYSVTRDELKKVTNPIDERMPDSGSFRLYTLSFYLCCCAFIHSLINANVDVDAPQPNTIHICICAILIIRLKATAWVWARTVALRLRIIPLCCVSEFVDSAY